MTTTAEHCWFNDVFVPIPVELLKEKEKKKRKRELFTFPNVVHNQRLSIKGLCVSRARARPIFEKPHESKMTKKKNWMCLHCSIHLYCTDKELIQTKWKPLGAWIWLFWYQCWTADFGEHHNSNREIKMHGIKKKKSEIKKQTFCVSAAVKPPFCSPAWEGRTSHSLITNKPSTKGTDFIIRMNWPFKLS